MKQGDILLIRYSFCPIGFLIRLITKSYYNHVCWILDDQFILECCGKGVIISKRSKFANIWLYDTKIVKLRDIDPKALKVAISRAKTMISREKWTYVKLIYTMIAILLGFRGIRFTCSSFIANALSMVKWYFIENKDPYLITPGDIARSWKIEEIKNE